MVGRRPPAYRTCPIIQARPRRSSPSSRARIQTSRRASSSCLSWTCYGEGCVEPSQTKELDKSMSRGQVYSSGLPNGPAEHERRYDRQLRDLEISDRQLSSLLEGTFDLLRNYWSGVERRPAYPTTNGETTARLFSRPWAEEGLGGKVLDDFTVIAEHSRASGGKFFGYVFGSGEPVGALGELLAAVLNQNVTAWRSAPAAVSIAAIGWLAEAVGCPGFRGSLCGGGSA